MLSDAGDAEAVALKPLADGLARPATDVPSAEAFSALAAEAGAERIGDSILAVVQSLPGYRAHTHGHAGETLPAQTLNAHADALVDCLADILEVAPPAGALRWSIVRGIRLGETEDGSAKLRMQIAHGSRPIAQTLRVDAARVEGWSPGDVVLASEDGATMVPLAPIAAATERDGEWHVGLLQREIRRPTLHYAAHVSEGFRQKLSKDVYARLAGQRTSSTEIDPELLATDPYRGLAAYDEEHAALFFGRDEERTAALSHLTEHGALVICGASGSGKSSLMRAGVVAALRAEADEDDLSFARVLFVPGDDPMEALCAHLATHMPYPIAEVRTRLEAGEAGAVLADLKGDGRAVIAVDQLEEAVVGGAPDAERKAFLNAFTSLAGAAKLAGVPVVATIRTDLLPALFEHAGVRKLVESHLLPLGAINEDGLIDVVRMPLQGRRIELEAGLAEEIVGDVGNEPGNLALLSQVLTTLWQDRGKYGNALTKAGYDAAGRVEGSLRTQADAAAGEVADRDQERLDALLVALARVTDEGTFVRKRAVVGELADVHGISAAEIRRILEPLVQARLLVFGGTEDAPHVEVAHEALLRSWPRLRDRLFAGQDAIRMQQRIAESARAWDASDRRSELWSDASSRLARAEEMVAAGQLQLAPLEKAFLHASRRKVRRRQQLTGLGAIVAVALAVVGIVLFGVARQAQAQAEAALEQAEGLIDYMVYDLYDRMDEVGRFDVMETLLAEVEGYYAELEAEGRPMMAEQRMRRGTALANLASIRIGQGDEATARPMYEEAVALARELLAEDPDDIERQIHLANMLNGMANTEELDPDQPSANEVLSMLEPLSEVHADNAQLLVAVGYAHRHLAFERGMNADYPTGIVHLEQAIHHYQEAAALEPDNVGTQLTLITMRRSLIMQTAYSGDMETAFALGLPLLEEANALVDENPRHMRIRLARADLLSRLSGGLNAVGQYQEAIGYSEQALEDYRMLVGEDATNQHWRDGLIQTLVIQVGIRAQLVQIDEALELLAEGRDVLEVFVDEELGGTATEVEQLAQVLRATCFFSALTRSRHEYATCGESILWAERLVEQQDVPFSRLVLADSLNGATFASIEQGDLGLAETWAQEAVTVSCELLEQLEGELVEGPAACAWALATHADLGLRLGEAAEPHDSIDRALEVLERSPEDFTDGGERWYALTLRGRALATTDPDGAIAAIAEGIDGALASLLLETTDHLNVFAIMLLPATRTLIELGATELAEGYLRQLVEALELFSQQAQLASFDGSRAAALVELAEILAGVDTQQSANLASAAVELYEGLEADGLLLPSERPLLLRAEQLSGAP